VIIETAFDCGHCHPCLTGNYVHMLSPIFYGHRSLQRASSSMGCLRAHLYIAPRAIGSQDQRPPPAGRSRISSGHCPGERHSLAAKVWGVSIGHTVVIEARASRCAG